MPNMQNSKHIAEVNLPSDCKKPRKKIQVIKITTTQIIIPNNRLPALYENVFFIYFSHLWTIERLRHGRHGPRRPRERCGSMS
jgi:hypothetical protein